MILGMRARCWIYVCFIPAILLLQAGSAWSSPQAQGSVSEDQIRKSHDLADLAPTDDPELSIPARLLSKGDASVLDLIKKAQQNRDPQQLAAQLKEWSKRHPAMAKMLEGMIGQDPAKLGDLSPKELEELQRRLQMHGAPSIAFPPVPPAANPENQPGPPMSGPQGAPAVPQPPAQNGNGITPQAPTQGEPNAQASALSRHLDDFRRGMEKLDPGLRHSAAVNNAFRTLARQLDADGGKSWEDLSANMGQLQERWSEWGKKLHVDRLVPEKGISWPEKLKLKWWPHINWKRAEDAVGRQLSADLPVAAPSGAAGSSNWQLLIGFAGLAFLVVVLWRVLAQAQFRHEQQEGGWRLGPWPVQPGQVASREDIVRAFEYLSLLCLGQSARTSNHHVIAEQLADQRRLSPQVAYFDERQHAVDELAALYEQARYAPPSEPLPETALAAARRDLCLLAGVTVA
jgi:hypothetical protein